MLVSQATGFQKPEKEIFQLAEKEFHMLPGELYMLATIMTMMF